MKAFLLGICCLLCSLPCFGWSDEIVNLVPVSGFPKLPPDYVLGRCSAVAINNQDEVYLFHRGKHPIICVTTEGKLLRSWGDDLIGSAHGIRIDRQNNVWVTDIGRHRVLKFDPHGKLLLALGTGKAGDAADQFNQPTDIAFGPDGEIFVSDGYGNSRVQKFSAAGQLLTTWGTRGTKSGEFHLPHALLIDSKGRLLVGDRENDRIQIFDLDGQHLETWLGFAPYGLAIDDQRQIFVADARASQLLLLNDAGKVIQKWGKPGTGAMEFNLPHMLAFDSKGNLYLAEVGNKRFQKFTKK